MLKKLQTNKTIRISTTIVILAFALIGFVLTSSFFAIKLHLFNDPGAVDYNDRYFSKNSEKDYDLLQRDTSLAEVTKIARFYHKLKLINEFYPLNATLINNAFLQHHNIAIAERMFDAVNLRLQNNTELQNKLNSLDQVFTEKKCDSAGVNIFEWMNIGEWQNFKISVVKDIALIDSAAKVTKVEPRLIVSVLLGEQMRLFNSTREVYKKVISPLKILSVESKFSLGVTGIKEETAIKVEKFLKDSLSPYYLGADFKHLLNFNSTDPKERFNRLVDYRNHYYSYLYAAIILRQVREQWLKAGYDISERPEILATLYNVGFEYSKPGPTPRVGGSRIKINENSYTFGALAYEFYYSGELLKEFPFKTKFW